MTSSTASTAPTSTPVAVDQAARVQADALAQEGATPTGGGDEAHVLAVGLGRGAQAEAGGMGPHRRPWSSSRPAAAPGRARRARACGARSSGPWPGRRPGRCGRCPSGAVDHAGVVTGGDGVEAEGVGPLQQPVELEVAVALDARVGRAPGGVGLDVGLDHVGQEVVAEVEHEVLRCRAAGRRGGRRRRRPPSSSPGRSRRPTASWSRR